MTTHKHSSDARPSGKVSLVLAALLTAVAGIACMNVRMTAPEKEVLVTVRDIADYVDLPGDYTNRERYTKTLYTDTTFSLEYEYSDDDLSLTSECDVEQRSSDFLISKTVKEKLFAAAYRSQGLAMVPRRDLYRMTNAVIYEIRKSNDAVVGNYAVICVDRKIYTVQLIGVYITDPDIWREILDPKMKRITGINTVIYRTVERIVTNVIREK
ncbi:MAG: hypothetical protein HZC28_08645 [Spirochaetes bacterium]|nr:hypothetical protein [Spirochaetota bacterium]